MVDDPNRKTPRQFQCRDYLWDSFEQLSGELECSIDYLINEAMRHYLRAQGRTGPAKGTGPGAAPDGRASLVPNAPAMQQNRAPTPAAATRQPALPPMPAARAPAGAPAPLGRTSMPGAPGPMIPPLASAARSPTSMPSMPSLPQRPPMGAPPGMSGAAPPMMGAPAPARPMPNAGTPMMSQRAAPIPATAAAAPRQRTLVAIYSDQEVPVTKEEFFIGRGQKMCDLVIRDTNISRQHARVVLHNAQYWMIDNQSTNGVEYRGAKIQQKRIDDGDVFTICGHDVTFAYR